MSTLRRLDCEQVRDLAPFYVLDALAPAEAAAVREHLATCPQPHPEIAELGGAVPYLAELPEPLEPDPAVGERLMAAIRADLDARRRDESAAARLVDAYGAAREPSPAPEPVSLAAQRARRVRPAWRLVLEAAAVIGLIAVLGWNLLLQGQLGAARDQAALLSQALAATTQPGSVTATIKGTGPAAGAAGFVVLPAGGPGYLVVSGLPEAPAGKTYQAWYIAADKATSAGIFEVGREGLVVEGGLRPGGPVAALGITIERAGGAPQPTMDPIALATFGG